MESGSWASYQSSLPIEARAGGEPDPDEPMPGRHDDEPPYAVAVLCMKSFEYRVTFTNYDPATDKYVTESYAASQQALVGRMFGAERWRWKHVLAWKTAMEKRYGHAWIEEYF